MTVMKTEIEWFAISETSVVLHFDIRVLLCDMHGNIHIGTRDDFGFNDDECHNLYNIKWWAYIPHSPVPRGIITNDAWIDNLIKAKK